VSFDVQLVGEWSLGPTTYVVEADGWYFAVDGPRGYSISSDGMSLTFAGENPTISFARIFGAGASLIGTWSRTIVDSGVTYVEEITFRPDGSFSTYWTEDGVFESDSSGKYEIAAGSILRAERRAQISTTPPDQILFDNPYGPDSSGSYVLSVDLSQWTVDLGGQTLTYVRLP
jgi:hypothetical protein